MSDNPNKILADSSGNQVDTIDDGGIRRLAIDIGETDAIHDNEAAEISAISSKVTPTTSDYLLIEDAADGDNKKSITIGDLPAAAPASHASDHISSGSDEVDGDKLDIDWNPTNYTPATTPTEVDDVDQLTAHLYGIDQVLADVGTDDDAIHDNVAGEINAVSEKSSPVSADWVIIEDSEDSNNKKKAQVGNLPGSSGTSVKRLGSWFANEVKYPTAVVPAEAGARNSHPTIDLDDSGYEYFDIHCDLPEHYDNGDVKLQLHVAAKTATSGNAYFGYQVERIGFESQDLDSDGFTTGVLFGAWAAPAVCGHVKLAETTITNAGLDGAQAGESIRIRIYRAGTYFSDNMTGDAQIVRIVLDEAD